MNCPRHNHIQNIEIIWEVDLQETLLLLCPQVADGVNEAQV